MRLRPTVPANEHRDTKTRSRFDCTERDREVRKMRQENKEQRASILRDQHICHGVSGSFANWQWLWKSMSGYLSPGQLYFQHWDFNWLQSLEPINRQPGEETHNQELLLDSIFKLNSIKTYFFFFCHKLYKRYVHSFFSSSEMACERHLSPKLWTLLIKSDSQRASWNAGSEAGRIFLVVCTCNSETMVPWS